MVFLSVYYRLEEPYTSMVIIIVSLTTYVLYLTWTDLKDWLIPNIKEDDKLDFRTGIYWRAKIIFLIQKIASMIRDVHEVFCKILELFCQHEREWIYQDYGNKIRWIKNTSYYVSHQGWVFAINVKRRFLNPILRPVDLFVSLLFTETSIYLRKRWFWEWRYYFWFAVMDIYVSFWVPIMRFYKKYFKKKK